MASVVHPVHEIVYRASSSALGGFSNLECNEFKLAVRQWTRRGLVQALEDHGRQDTLLSLGIHEGAMVISEVIALHRSRVFPGQVMVLGGPVH